MTTEQTSPTARPTRVRWCVFALAFATSWLLYLHRYIFAFVKPTLSRQWDLSNTDLGRLDSAFAACYALCQFPLGMVADAWGVRRVLTGLIVVWCSGLALLASAPNAQWLWYALAALGTGQSAVYACLNRVARNWFPSAVRTTLQGAVGVLAGRLGALSSSLVFTTLLLGVCGLEWRVAVWLLAAVGVGHLLLFGHQFRNSPRAHPGVNEEELRLIEGPLAAGAGVPSTAARDEFTVSRTLRSMSPRALLNLGVLSLQTLLSTFADNIYSNWIPMFLSQVHQLEYKAMGVYASLPLLGGALAGLLGGWLNDYWIQRSGNRRWSRVGVAFAGKGLAAVWMLLALTCYDRPYLFCSLLFFVKLFGDWSLVTAWGVVTDIGGPATASVFAFSNSIAAIGLIAAPQVFGRVADQFGWQMVFFTVAVTYVLCAISWFFIDCTIPVVTDGGRSRRGDR